MIEGSDAALKNECIVYTAHFDHFGIGAPVKNDSIYNGAHDDASGNAILLEVIRAYRPLSKPPKRSIVFAIVTGEELGLLGSDYFVNNQPPNLGKIVANLGIDMPFFFILFWILFLMAQTIRASVYKLKRQPNILD